MTRLILLFTTLAIGVLFNFFSPTGEVGFPFSDMVLTIETYFYFLFEHLIVLLLALVIFDLEPRYKIAVGAFVLIQIIDILDYVLFYAEDWSPYLPSWNFLKVGIFAIATAYDRRHE